MTRNNIIISTHDSQHILITSLSSLLAPLPPLQTIMSNPSTTTGGTINGSITVDSDSSVEVIPQPWEKLVVRTNPYKIAFDIFQGRKYGSPTTDKMRALLAKFADPLSTEFFRRNSTRAGEFEKIQKIIKNTNRGAVSTRNKMWNKTYVGDILAKLLILRASEKKEREQQQNSGTGRGRGNGMTPLIRIFVGLEKIYNPCLILYQEEELRELNKKHKTPTLNHQLTGKRTQDNHSFDPAKKDNNACPVCNHKSTMGMGNEETNTTNSSRRAEAEAGDETKFDGVAAEHGCYCIFIDCHGSSDGRGCYKCFDLAKKGVNPIANVEVGYCGFVECDICSHGKDDKGCQCQVKFEEHKRQFIALALHRQKLQNEKKTKKAKPPPGTASSALFNRLSER